MVGEHLDSDKQEVRIALKRRKDKDGEAPTNELVISLAGDDGGVSADLSVNVASVVGTTRQRSINVLTAGGLGGLGGLASGLESAIDGADHPAQLCQAELDLAWNWFQPVRVAHQAGATKVHGYAQGSSGPAKALENFLRKMAEDK